MNGKNSIHFSSGNDCWGTPLDIFEELHMEFGFDLDVCALPETAIRHHYCIPPVGAEYHILWPGHAWIDGLAQDWHRFGTCWMNPPYSKLKDWLCKASKEAKLGATVVCLFPSRTDTKAWHDYVWDEFNHRPRPGVEVRFIRGRLKFRGAKDPAPFPSVVVIFRKPKPHETDQRKTHLACQSEIQSQPANHSNYNQERRCCIQESATLHRIG